MFDGQRGFRAILFSSSLKTAEEICSLFPAGSFADDLTVINSDSPNFNVHHGYYLSTTAYLSPEALLDVRMANGDAFLYKYDFYICRWQRLRKNMFIFAVPFSKMAVDIFSVIHESARSSKRLYRRINLQSLVDNLAMESAPAGELIASSVRFLVSGSDTVKSLDVSGTDVVGSEYYRRTIKMLKGMRLIPRRVRLRSGSNPRSLAIETDSHGNYWFYTKKGGSNLSQLEIVLAALDGADLIEETPHYPLRPGIRKEEDDDRE